VSADRNASAAGITRTSDPSAETERNGRGTLLLQACLMSRTPSHQTLRPPSVTDPCEERDKRTAESAGVAPSKIAPQVFSGRGSSPCIPDASPVAAARSRSASLLPSAAGDVPQVWVLSWRRRSPRPCSAPTPHVPISASSSIRCSPSDVVGRRRPGRMDPQGRPLRRQPLPRTNEWQSLRRRGSTTRGASR
jgi:hypothetical protein